ncbi:carboxylesterase/lipase family protein [Bordetella genomosp. 5]|uniref:Carboxylic ester hydrolase n=1 Tax=Bordetella genomosp. 5 TaxID=1395608 RepID=A0A261TQT5_9BORD|nr:carboxylesterase family protein [Bordetella genomosp. 5]OZI51996.1 carboxylesterase [Bordetella genomosp. 5]
MNESCTARLKAGTVNGQRRGGVCRFDAIPYAAPPVGPLRWAPPQPAAWQGTLDATRPGPVAPQMPSRLREAMGDFDAAQSEDCLHLTVWAPAPDGARRPVVVWLHGGAWQSGGGALPWYDGAPLATAGDVVVVGVNYRLAALGWLCLPGRTANVGLLDQEAALDWVIANIDAFGGDPARITVMGQSAGASSICAMLTRAPRFDRAILQSAALGRGFRGADQAEAIAHAIMRACGVSDLDALRDVPVAALLHAQQDAGVLAALDAEGAHRSLFGPVADGAVLPQDMHAALDAAAGLADVLVSYTRDEMAAFPGMGRDGPGQALGESIFGAPARAWAANAARLGRQAWLARFDVAPTERFGACHCIDLPFVFGTLPAYTGAPMLAGLDPREARALADRTQRAWLAFIRGEAPDWPAAPHQQLLAAH